MFCTRTGRFENQILYNPAHVPRTKFKIDFLQTEYSHERNLFQVIDLFLRGEFTRDYFNRLTRVFLTRETLSICLGHVLQSIRKSNFIQSRATRPKVQERSFTKSRTCTKASLLRIIFFRPESRSLFNRDPRVRIPNPSTLQVFVSRAKFCSSAKSSIWRSNFIPSLASKKKETKSKFSHLNTRYSKRRGRLYGSSLNDATRREERENWNKTSIRSFVRDGR